ncbi:MAG: hypothetical protein ACD_23C00346G0002 [uncultured bacterium]|nr:MAG: hypothetical protein ACD_23C00346G0002 [uncultured bacterium]
MSLNLRQIEVFRAIMLTGSISGAAKLLNVSQPAVSRLIAYTESRVGLILFERIKGRLYPTPEARRLFVEVDVVYQGVQRVNEVASDLVEKRSGTLRLAVSPSLGQTLLPMAVAKFRERFPDVKIHLQTLVSPHLAQALLTQQAEVGVATIFKLDHPNLEVRPIYEDRLVAVLPTTHPLADRKELHVRDLADLSLIGYGLDTPFGQMIEQMFQGEGMAPRLSVEVRLTHIACAMVQAGAGVAIVDELAVIGRVWPDVVVRPILPATVMPVNLLHLRFEPLSRLAQDFIETLTNLKYHSLRAIS